MTLMLSRAAPRRERVRDDMFDSKGKSLVEEAWISTIATSQRCQA